MAWTNRISAVAAFLVSVSLVASPAGAVDLPRSEPAQARAAYDSAAENVEHRRRYRDDGIDAGDVIAGVLILGGIAAIAGAANRSPDEVERYPEPYPYPEDPRYRDRSRGYESRGIESAVEMCVAEVEVSRDRVITVDSASRTGEGWFVSGEIEDRVPFTCRINNDGRIGAIEFGDPSYETDAGWDQQIDRQYGDDVYYRARAGQRGAGDEPYTYAP